MNSVKLKIDKISYFFQLRGIKKYLENQNGIEKIKINLILNTIDISYTDEISLDNICYFIKELGFDTTIYNDNIIKINNTKKDLILLIIFGILLLITFYLSIYNRFISNNIIDKNIVNYIMILMDISILFILYSIDIIKSGIKGLINKRPNIYTLISISILSTFLYSIYGSINIFLGNVNYIYYIYFDLCIVLIYSTKLYKYINKSMCKKIERFRDILCNPYNEKINLKKGSIIEYNTGDEVLFDVVVNKGSAYISEERLNSNINPILKKSKDEIKKGSIILDGNIKCSIQKRVVKNKSYVNIINDKYSYNPIKYKKVLKIIYLLCIISIFILVGYTICGVDIRDTINILAIVLMLSTPIVLPFTSLYTVLKAQKKCLKNGILIKNSSIFDKLSKIDTVVFDKTGTLTNGYLGITNILNYSNYDDKEIIKIVSSLLVRTNNLESCAFKKYVEYFNVSLYDIDNNLDISKDVIHGYVLKKDIYVGNNKIFNKLKIKNEYKEDESKFINNKDNILYVLEDKKVIAIISIGDTIRKSSKKCISKLSDINMEVLMISEDNADNTEYVSNVCGIKKYISNLENKEKVIEKIKSNNKNIMMVCDGINDFEALKIADVKVSMGSGDNRIKLLSDIILINNNLSNIQNLIIISKKVVKNIKQNLFWIYLYNICMILNFTILYHIVGNTMNIIIILISILIGIFTIIYNSLNID